MDQKLLLFGAFPGIANDNLANGVQLSNPPDFQLPLSGSASSNHISILFSDGKAASMGSNSKNQLGDGSTQNSMKLVQVQIDANLRFVACGHEFTIWVADDGTIYTSGLSESSIPEVYPRFKAVHCAAYKLRAAIVTDKGTVVVWPDFHQIENFKEYSLINKAIEVSCGLSFVSVLMENQTILRIYDDGRFEPLLMQSTRVSVSDRFLRMSSCENYTVAVDFNKDVWLFGELGRFNSNSINPPPLFSNVIDVFAFPKAVVAIMNPNFLVYSVGEDTDGQFAASSSYESAKAELPFPVMSVIGNERMHVYIPKPITRCFTEFDQSNFIPGFHKYYSQGFPMP